MKLQLFAIAIALMSIINLQAQTEVTELNINGLKVLYKPSPKQSVSAYLFFRGGTANYSIQQEGIESLALSAATECGTQKYTKDDFKDLEDKYGIDVSAGARYDYGYISMSCVKPFFNEGWELFAEAINRPVFDEKEFSLLQQKLISQLKSNESDPDEALSKLVTKDVFKDTRYEILPEGSVETLTAFKASDVKDYYRKLLNVNRLLLVVVGNLSVQEIKQKVEATFAQLPSGPISPLDVATAKKITANTLNVENRNLATNYITGVLGSPAVTDAQFNVYRLGFNILYDKLFEEVRTKRNLSYAPMAYLSPGLLSSAEVYVTSTKPKEAVTVMVDEIKRLRNGGFTATDLRNAKSMLSTSYFMKNESSASNALSLGVAEIRGSWKDEIGLLDHINAVTLDQLQRTFAEYADGIKWSYLGDESLADKEAFEKTTK